MGMLVRMLLLLQRVGKPGVSYPSRISVDGRRNHNPSVIHKLQVELRWIGKLPGNPSRVELPGGPRSFYKIKVDEEAGYVINTFTHGGLIVSDICDHRILWALEEVLTSNP